MNHELHSPLQIIAANAYAMNSCDGEERSQLYHTVVRDLLATLRTVSQREATDSLLDYSCRRDFYELAHMFEFREQTRDLFSKARYVSPQFSELFSGGLWVGIRGVTLDLQDFSKCGIIREFGAPKEYAAANNCKVLGAAINGKPEFMMYGLDLSKLSTGPLPHKAWWLVQHDGVFPQMCWAPREIREKYRM